MSEPLNPAPPPLVPPLLTTPTANAHSAAKGAWGFWQTVGWGAIIACAYLAVQLIVVLVYVIGFTVAHKSGSPPSINEIESSGMIMAVAVILCVPVVVGLSILFAQLRKGPAVRDYLGWHWPTLRQFTGWTLGSIIFMVASDCLTVVLGRPIVPEVMVDVYRSTSFLPLLWFGLVIAAPLSEEILFRGFLFRGLAESPLGGTVTVFLTAGLWAIIHLQYDAYGIANIFAFGIVLGFARLKTGSVVLCMVLHGFMNLLVTMEVVIFFPSS